MADIYLLKISDLYETCYLWVFEVTDYESKVKITKNKMAVPIWRTYTYILKISDLFEIWHLGVFEVAAYVKFAKIRCLTFFKELKGPS